MNEERKGELFQFGGSILWAIFPVITVLTYSSLPSLVSLAWSTVICTVFFLALMAVKNLWHELRNWEVWKNVFGVVVFIGVIFYSLLYIGLTKTTPGNASIIGLAEILTSFLFFHIIQKESFSKRHMMGALLMLIGAGIVLIPGYSGAHRGDLVILLGLCFSPVGNYFQRKARTFASSVTVMFLRELLSIPIVFILAWLLHMHAGQGEVLRALPYLFISGVFLFGLSKIFWIESIHRISVTKANALASIGPLFTLFFAWLILHQAPTMWQLVSLVPLTAGIVLLTGWKPFKKVV